jgi:putative dehydrogenase
MGLASEPPVERGPGICVGVIGLGKMGMPIARNLIERGFDVVGYRRHPTAELVEAGGLSADSPAEVAERSNVLLSILPTADDLHSVLHGSAGILPALRAGTIHIEMSTINLDRKTGLAEDVRSVGADMLDCPISGSPAMVAPRLATTFVSGSEASVDQVRPVLDAISGRWAYAGSFGCGTHLKYVANLLLAVHTVAAAEALVLAQRSGLDLELVQRTLDESIASSAIWKQRGPAMRERIWKPAPGPIATLHEILEQIGEYSNELGAPHPVFDAAKAVFDTAVAEGNADLDIAYVFDVLAARSQSPARPNADEPRVSK